MLRLRDLLHLTARHSTDPWSALVELSKPEFVFEGLKADASEALRENPLLSHFHPSGAEPVKCVRGLSYSGFNPPPANRRLMGDFYYIDYTPIEVDLPAVVICANTRGFYVTQSKQGKFSPLAASKSCHASTLAGCLSHYSTKFKKLFDEALQQHHKQTVQEQGSVAFPPNAWLARSLKAHEFDLGRSEQDLMKFTETAVMSVTNGRDWNEELQLAHEMPRTTPQERIARDRTRYRVHAEYVDAASQAALAIFNGQIQPLNPNDAPSAWIYVFNNIFFTQANDMRGVYADCGGDETFEKSVSNDLVALKKFNETDPVDLHALDNVLIRYCGRTLFAQTIVPGLFNGLVTGESAVVYGSLEAGQEVSADPEVHAKIGKIASALYLKEHTVLSKPKPVEEKTKEGEEKAAAVDSEPTPVTLWTSADIKGVNGTDKRTYLLDFGHMFARDGNYSSAATPTAVYRPELLQAYVTRQWLMARTKAIAEKRAQLLKERQEVEAKGEKFEFPESLGLPEIRVPTLAMNTDLYRAKVELKCSAATQEADVQLNSSIARFLSDECIPMLVNDWASSAATLPIDSETLKQALHARGINMRYLGSLAKAVLPIVPAARDVVYREMVVRASVSAFRRLVQKVPHYSLGEFVISFLNAFFDKMSTAGKGSRSGVKPVHLTEAQAAATVSSRDDEFGLSHHSLWVTIRQLVEAKFNYTLPEFIPAGVFEIATLRTLCQKLGVKLEAKNYDFNKDRPFEASNLIEMQSVIKHVAPATRDGMQLIAAGKQLLAEGKEEAAMELLQEAVSLYHQCFGPLHRDVGATFSTLALVAFNAGDVDNALQFIERAAFIHERSLGADHHDTVHSYGNFATMLSAVGQHTVALNYLRRALYLGIIAAGWYHPETASTYVNMAIVMHDMKQYRESLHVLNKAQKIIDHIIAQTKDVNPELELAINAVHYSLSAAIAHLQAIANAGISNFREALTLEKKNYTLLKQMKVPEDDPRVAEANTWLNELTRKAVEAEKSAKAHAAAEGATRIGGKKGVNTKVLKSALDKASSLGVTSGAHPSTAATSIKRATRSPNSVIGKGVTSSSAVPSSTAAHAHSHVASSSHSHATAASSSAKSGKKGNTAKKSTSSVAPVPDLL